MPLPKTRLASPAAPTQHAATPDARRPRPKSSSGFEIASVWAWAQGLSYTHAEMPAKAAVEVDGDGKRHTAMAVDAACLFVFGPPTAGFFRPWSTHIFERITFTASPRPGFTLEPASKPDEEARDP